LTDLPNDSLADCRLLIVEDEYFIADDIARMLQEFGAEVVGPAANLKGALALLSSGERIDAAVLDVNLRGEMIFPVADVLQQRGIPFVFATGYDEAAVPSRYRDVPRWEKPFSFDSLVQALPTLMRRR
jgi:CheY-like chemotaxis protein